MTQLSKMTTKIFWNCKSFEIEFQRKNKKNPFLVLFFSDKSDQENLLSSAFRRLTETRIDIQDNPLEAHFALNIRGGVLKNAGNFYSYHLKLQNALDKNFSDSIHSPVFKDYSKQ